MARSSYLRNEVRSSKMTAEEVIIFESESSALAFVTRMSEVPRHRKGAATKQISARHFIGVGLVIPQ